MLTKTNALERKDGGTDEKRKVVAVEQLNVGTNAVVGQAVDAEVPEVDDTEDNEQVGKHTGQGQDRHTADQDQGDQNHKRYKDVNLRLDTMEGAFGEGLHHSVNVLRNKDQVGTAETDLRQGNRHQHGQAHVGTKESLADILETLADDQAHLDQHQEGDTADNGDKSKAQA